MENKKINSMSERLLAIVDLGKEKRFYYIVNPCDIQSFLGHHSSKYFSCPPPIIFQSVLVYDPDSFQSELSSLWKSNSISNPFNNTFKK